MDWRVFCLFWFIITAPVAVGMLLPLTFSNLLLYYPPYTPSAISIPSTSNLSPTLSGNPFSLPTLSFISVSAASDRFFAFCCSLLRQVIAISRLVIVFADLFAYQSFSSPSFYCLAFSSYRASNNSHPSGCFKRLCCNVSDFYIRVLTLHQSLSLDE